MLSEKDDLHIRHCVKSSVPIGWRAGGSQGCGSAFFLADQDPADFLNADSDPDPAALYMRIRTQIRIQQKFFCKTYPCEDLS